MAKENLKLTETSPSIELQIAYIQQVRKEAETSRNKATVVWHQDDATLQAIEENLIAIRNLKYHGK